MLTLNKKQGRLVEEVTEEQEMSNDSDRMVNEQIGNTLEIISKIIEANI
jgi:hypothetical protein